MKLRFAFLRLGESSRTHNLGGPYHGLDRLSVLATHMESCKVPTLTLSALESLDDSARENLVVFIAGNPEAQVLKDSVLKLDALGVAPLIVVDALVDFESLRPVLGELLEKRFQTVITAQVPGLVKTPRLMLYQYGKVDLTITLLVITGAGTKNARVLVIRRDRNPFAGSLAFPGGFVDAHIESLPEGGAREGVEETSVTVPPDHLELVDVRSKPARDERGQVVDHGYMWLVPGHQTAAVLASAHAGDDAKPGSAEFALVSDLLNGGPMAFDHYELLLAAVRTGKVLPASGVALRLTRWLGRLIQRLALSLERRDAVYGRFHDRGVKQGRE